MESATELETTAAEPLLSVAADDGASQAAPARYRHRVFYRVPNQSADFDDEYEERAAQWFELFVDLILVVAWTNVTDALFESEEGTLYSLCLLYTSPSPRDQRGSRMPSSA